MRGSLLLALTVGAFGLLAPSAGATYHLIRINEIFPSATTSQQFVELKDPVPEPFPPPDDYWLALHNGAGTLQQQQKLPSAEYRNSTAPYLVAASAPFDEQLAFQLPTGSGQLCFYRGHPTSPAADRVDCLGYGSVSNPLGATGPAPAAGQSLQRLACGDVGPAAPTRDAENAACPSGGGGGGGGGTGGADVTDPFVRLRARRRQDVDRLAIVVRSNENGTVTVRGRASRTLRFKTVKRSLEAGKRKRIRLRLTRSRKRALKRALARGRRLRARLRITVRDRAGNATVKRLRIRLKD